MERRKRFRKALKRSAQKRRNSAIEMAQEFPEGAFGAPPIQSDRRERTVKDENETKQE